MNRYSTFLYWLLALLATLLLIALKQKRYFFTSPAFRIDSQILV